MGAGVSTEIDDPIITVIQSWNVAKVDDVIRSYKEKELDFAIGEKAVSFITGFSSKDSTKLIQMLSHDREGNIVNALTLLAALICLCESGQQLINTRAGTLFDLCDFDGSSQISMEETIILLMCIANAMAAVSGKKDSVSKDFYFVQLAQELYEDRERASSRTLHKHEFIAWAEKQVFEVEHVSVSNVYTALFERQPSDRKSVKLKGTMGYVEVKKISLSEIYDSEREEVSSVFVEIHLVDLISCKTISQNIDIDPKWQMHEISSKVASSQILDKFLSIMVKDSYDGSLFSRASVPCSSLLSSLGAWVEITGQIEDTHQNSNGSFSLLARFRPHNMPPDDDGFLEIEWISLESLKNRAGMFQTQRVVTEFRIGNGDTWRHVTKSKTDNGGVTWSPDISGLIDSKVIKEGKFKIHVKSVEDEETYHLIGKDEIDTTALLKQRGQWVEIEGVLLDNSEDFAGNYSIRAKFRPPNEPAAASGKINTQIDDNDDSNPLKNSTTTTDDAPVTESAEVPVTVVVSSAPASVEGFLEVELVRAKEMRNTAGLFEGKQDVFVELKVGEGYIWEHVTYVAVDAGARAVWYTDISGLVDSSEIREEGLKIRVKSKADDKEKLVGKAELSGSDLEVLFAEMGQWVDLRGDLLDKEGGMAGQFKIRAKFRPPEMAAESSNLVPTPREDISIATSTVPDAVVESVIEAPVATATAVDVNESGDVLKVPSVEKSHSEDKAVAAIDPSAESAIAGEKTLDTVRGASPTAATDDAPVTETAEPPVTVVVSSAPASVEGFLEVELVRAKEMRNTAGLFEGKQDVFAELKVGEGYIWEHVTYVAVDAGARAVWYTDISGLVDSSEIREEGLKIRVKSKADDKEKLVGKAELSGSDLEVLFAEMGQWVDLRGDLLDKEGGMAGQFKIRAKFRPPEMAAESSNLVPTPREDISIATSTVPDAVGDVIVPACPVENSESAEELPMSRSNSVTVDDRPVSVCSD